VNKIAQNVAQPVFLTNFITKFCQGENWPITWARYVNYINVPKDKNISIGENSPNLVTRSTGENDELNVARKQTRDPTAIDSFCS
jgi:hypothetical protein